MADIQRADPIFIQGILPRSGTNFLWDLLLLHPECGRARIPVQEDLFLDHTDHLLAFTEAARRAWDPAWGAFSPELMAHLHAGLGEGLVSFLWTDRERRLVAKSPSVRHLERFFTFFPWARLVILVRDGRSVVHSAMSTFGWEFDRACREWAGAADTIRRFQGDEAARSDLWRLVRYEDLVDDTEGQLRSLFEFLDLDPTRYDFEAARTLPVHGSSAFGREHGAVHWKPVSKDATFSPKERWRSWSDAQLQRFEWLAGEQLVSLGYPPCPVAQRTLGTTARECLLDGRWAARQAVRSTRAHLGNMSRPLRRRLGLAR